MAEKQITRNDVLTASFKTVLILGDDWVNVYRVIDRKTARKLRWLAGQTGASVVTVLERSIELLLAADEAYEHHCPIDDARAVDRVFLLAHRCVYRAAQSPRYQAAFVFLRLWRWSLLPVLADSLTIVGVQPGS